jgi:pyrroline-5-carboxylate reductase
MAEAGPAAVAGRFGAARPPLLRLDWTTPAMRIAPGSMPAGSTGSEAAAVADADRECRRGRDDAPRACRLPTPRLSPSSTPAPTFGVLQDRAGRPAMSLRLDGTLVLAGAGNMGGAMLAGWLERGLDPRRILVQDPGPPPAVTALLAKHDIQHRPVLTLDAPPAVLLVAVKPQVMEAVFPPLARQVGPETVVLSVAAGRTIASFARHLPAATAIVRSIPNTPASVGRAITAAVANGHVGAKQRELCDGLLRAIGSVVWVEDEAQIDAATAVSGSGPAYVFLLAECLAEAGRKAGLPAALAGELARWTVAGAGELLHRSQLPAAELRRQVTSPNGTTHAALQVLMAEGGLQPLLDAAVAAAARRSKELSQ